MSTVVGGWEFLSAESRWYVLLSFSSLFTGLVAFDDDEMLIPYLSLSFPSR